MDTALAIAGASGVLASLLTEVLNRATPGHKFRPQTLQAVSLTAAAAGVVGFQLWSKAAIDWNAVIPQVFGAWSVALAVHDVASPRGKEVAQP